MAAAPGPTAAVPIHFESGPAPGDMELSTPIEGCSLHLDYFAAWKTARLRAVGLEAPGCTAPFEPRLARLRDLVLALQVKVARHPPFQSFGFYGRLADYEPMARRVALAASRSPEWDAATGASRSVPIGALVTKLADENKAYVEVAELFAAMGYTAHLAGVEKVVVQEAGVLPYAGWLASQGVAEAARLPSDFIFGFRIAPPVMPPRHRSPPAPR